MPSTTRYKYGDIGNPPGHLPDLTPPKEDRLSSSPQIVQFLESGFSPRRHYIADRR